MNTATSQSSQNIALNKDNFKLALEEGDFQRAYTIFIDSLPISTKLDSLPIQQIHQLIHILLNLKMYNNIIDLIPFPPSEPLNIDDLDLLLTLAESHLNLYQFNKAESVLKKIAHYMTKYNSLILNPKEMEDRFDVLYDSVKHCKAVSQVERRTEAEEYKVLLEKTPSDLFSSEGNEIYLIPTTWITKWKEYSGFAYLFESADTMIDENQEPKPFEELYPGPILIDSLLEPKKQQKNIILIDSKADTFHQNYQLKIGSAEGRDFIFAGKHISDFFYSRYGGMRLKRLTIRNPITEEHVVDLFYKRINFIPIPSISPQQKKETLYTIFIPSFDSLLDLNHKIKRSLKYLPQLSTQIWNRQYFKISKLSKDLSKNYSSCFTVLLKSYNDPIIYLDIQENGLKDENLIEDLEVSTEDIFLFELSNTNNFKIQQAKKKQNIQEVSKEYSSKSDSINSTSSMVIESEGETSFPNGKIRQRPFDQQHVKSMRDKFNLKQFQGGFLGRKGTTGLQNLGNTCFMNSSLQCLSNVEELTTFFVNSEFLNDLNPNNPLGANGYLAVSYAYLMREMWQGGESSVSAHQLKKVVGKFAPQFYGYNQQDSQELLSYMLDGIHEDLNRVRKKPTVEAIDYSGGEDEKYSALFYQNYRKRNDSVISDLMMGQFKSTLVCPKCKQISVIFDPFLTLSVPIQVPPKVKTEELQFYAVFKDSRKIPHKLTPILRSDLTVSELKEIVANNFNSSPKNYIVVTNYQFKLEKIFKDDAPISSLKDADGPIFVYEIEHPYRNISEVIKDPIIIDEEKSSEEGENQEKSGQKGPNDYILVEVLIHSVSQKHLDVGIFNNSNLQETVSFPRLLSLRASSTIREIYIQLYSLIRSSLLIYQKINLSPKISVDIDIENVSQEQLLLEINSFEREEKQKLFKFTSTNGEPFSVDNTETQLVQLCGGEREQMRMKIFLTKDFEFKYMKLKSSELGTLVIPKSFSNVNSNGGNGDGLNLMNCISAFVRKEKLENGNEWYCNKCKEHVLATKQMEIYKTPKILIIHLKRFKSGNVKNFGKYFYESGGKKINEHIDFPIQNLDLSEYVIGEKNNPQIYDLFAVSQHYGGMGGGHYTACAQNFINKKWYNFNDSHVSQTTADQAVSSAAYVLFYRRREN